MIRSAITHVLLVRDLRARVAPLVREELAGWTALARGIEDPALRREALSSLTHKRFHVAGAAIFAARLPSQARLSLAVFLTAYQTLCDYLDNLCDRLGRTTAAELTERPFSEAQFALLHRSLASALSPGGAARPDFYGDAPHRESVYLPALVDRCRTALADLPSYPVVQKLVRRLAVWYADIQVAKHGARHQRAERLTRLAASRGLNRDLAWWEIAAASASTLALFALCRAATRPLLRRDEVGAVLATYFPRLCAFHILLDYWTDQREDLVHGDFSFTACYANRGAALRGIEALGHAAQKDAARAADPIARLIALGLPAVYLSDARLRPSDLMAERRRLSRLSGPLVRHLARGALRSFEP